MTVTGRGNAAGPARSDALTEDAALEAAMPKGPLDPTLPAGAYLDPAWHEREMRACFRSGWVLACREEELTAPGAFVRTTIDGDDLLIVRGADEKIRAFHNVCRHRGSRLIIDEPSRGDAPACAPLAPAEHGASGKTKSVFRCPYHSWTYELDGSLRTAPFLQELPGFEKSDLGLYAAAAATWGGFVFIKLDTVSASAPRGSLIEALGPISERVARYPLADLRIAHRTIYDVAANWKVILENYNECYHCGPVHPELCRVVPAFREAGGAGLDWEAGIPHRDGAWTYTMSGTSLRDRFAGLNEDELVRHKGEVLYPNMMLSLSADHAAVFALIPLNPNRTKIVFDLLLDPKEMDTPGHGPEDALEFWDVVNRQDWRICESVQQGMTSSVFKAGYYAPMEDYSLDMRRYIRETVGEPPLRGRAQR